MSEPDTYEIHAIRYAVNRERVRGQNFILDQTPMERLQLDFFSWVAIGRKHTFVIDTGMSADAAYRHGHEFLRCPTDVLRKLDVDPDAATDVILTHLHFDHIGNVDKFPRARFHLHDLEMSFATGRHMRHQWIRRVYLPDEIARMVHYVHEGRVRFHDEDVELAPGLSVHWVGGHSAGQEFVRIRTDRGWVVLASDVIHYYEELERTIPFAVAFDIGQMLEAHDAMLEMADSAEHIIPGHDPLVMDRYPASSPALEGICARVSAEPVQ